MGLIICYLDKHELYSDAAAAPTDIHMVPVRKKSPAARLITLRETRLLLVVCRPEAEAEASMLLSWSTQDHVSG